MTPSRRQSAKDHQPLRVLIAYSYSMHYRLGVFAALLEEPRIEATLAAGRTPGAGRNTVSPVDEADLPALQWHRTHSLGPLRWQPSLLRQSLSRRYDVVLWDPSIYSVTMWLSAALLRAQGRTVLFWGLGWTKTHGRFKERIKVVAFRLAHGFLTYGPRSGELAVAAGYPPSRLRVIGNSISDTAPARAAIARGMPNLDPLVLGAALRLTPRKRVDLLIRAVAALRKHDINARAIIVGDGECAEELRSLAAELDADIEFLGPLYAADEIAAYYKRIHVTVIPGAAGLTITSSLMHGRPVITHSNAANHGAEWEQMEPGISGAFYDEGDLDSLVQTILDVRDQLGAAPGASTKVAEQCRAAYLEHGDPTAHARRIVDAVLEFADSRGQLAPR